MNREEEVLLIVSEMDQKLLDATIPTISAKLKRRGFVASYDTVRNTIMGLVEEGSLIAQEMGGLQRTNRYFRTDREGMVA